MANQAQNNPKIVWSRLKQNNPKLGFLNKQFHTNSLEDPINQINKLLIIQNQITDFRIFEQI